MNLLFGLWSWENIPSISSEKLCGNARPVRLISIVAAGLLFLLVGPVLSFRNTAIAASSGQSNVIDSHKLLDLMRQLSSIGDLRDHEKIAQLFGLELTEKRYDRSIWYRAASHPQWIGDFNYSLVGSPPGREHQNISIIVAQPPCVTPGDVVAEFGRPNLPSDKWVTAPTFIDEKAAHSYIEEIKRGQGVIGMNYNVRDLPRTTLSFDFRLRRCLQSAGVSIDLLSEQTQPSHQERK
jgi:hypothetical protein